MYPGHGTLEATAAGIPPGFWAPMQGGPQGFPSLAGLSLPWEI